MWRLLAPQLRRFDLVRECRPWLCQGDLFESVATIVVRQDFSEAVEPLVDEGAALLLSEGCQLDKRRSNGKPHIPRLVFSPINSLVSAMLGPDIEGRLRRGEVAPPGVVYIDNVGDGTEGVALLSEAYPIPAPYFALVSEDFSAHDEADPKDPFHMVAQRHNERRFTMTDDEVYLLHSKIAAFWTGTVLPPRHQGPEPVK